MKNRDKIALFEPGKPAHIRRKVRHCKRYGDFILGLAYIYGKVRIVKRFGGRDFWHVPDANLDLPTKIAIADYRNSYDTSEEGNRGEAV